MANLEMVDREPQDIAKAPMENDSGTKGEGVDLSEASMPEANRVESQQEQAERNADIMRSDVMNALD